MTDVKKTLEARGQNYGAFEQHAAISEALNVVLENSPAPLKAHHKEALRIIFNKIGRILNGNPDYVDSWRDIAGYSQLVVDILLMQEGATDSMVVPVVRTGMEWVKQK